MLLKITPAKNSSPKNFICVFAVHEQSAILFHTLKNGRHDSIARAGEAQQWAIEP